MPRLPHVALLAGMACAAACAKTLPIGVARADDGGSRAATVSVPFVTIRAREPLSGGGEYFGEEEGELSAGRCRVGFEEPDYGDGGTLLETSSAPLTEVLDGLGTRPAAEPVLYVHGYGENFAKNCRRAAILLDRAKLDGRMLLFSWPANRNYLTYHADVEDLEDSVADLRLLLTALAERFDASRVHLVAHSLGSRGMVEALAGDGALPRFGTLVLVAPDIDVDTFVATLPLLEDRVSAITVYVSDRDRVLPLSEAINLSERLGQAPDLEIDAESVRIVDVSPTGRSNFSGHVYHLYNAAVVEDLARVLSPGSLPPPRLAQREPVAGSVYRLVPIAAQ